VTDGREVVCLSVLVRLHEARALGLLVLLVLVVDTLRQLTRIGGVADGAVLPRIVGHELALEVEGVVDVSEAELDVRVLGELS
jgi:hypothetical protein